jgi:chromosome partitioning protein
MKPLHWQSGCLAKDQLMPVVSFVSSKGGVGKTTAALLLSTGLADAGVSVAVVDADPNQPLMAWAKFAADAVPSGLTVRGEVNEDNILEVIEGLSTASQVVIVDTQGAGNLTSSYAVSISDLVLVPLQASPLDGREGMKTVSLVKRQRKLTNRAIPCAAVWQRANAAIETRSAKDVREQFAEAGVPFLETKLVDREPFKTMYREGETLARLEQREPTNQSIRKARENAWVFALEVIKCVKGREITV